MSKKTFILAAMAEMLAASNDMYGSPLLPVNRPMEYKRTSSKDKKKCKSCKHFSKGDYNCYCSIHSRTYVSPMDVACGGYEKRKK